MAFAKISGLGLMVFTTAHTFFFFFFFLIVTSEIKMAGSHKLLVV